MANDPYLTGVAILLERGFLLTDIWKEPLWDGDMPEDFVEAFAMIYQRLDEEKTQRLLGGK